jgi:hypothetical protein
LLKRLTSLSSRFSPFEFSGLSAGAVSDGKNLDNLFLLPNAVINDEGRYNHGPYYSGGISPRKVYLATMREVVQRIDRVKNARQNRSGILR